MGATNWRSLILRPWRWKATFLKLVADQRQLQFTLPLLEQTQDSNRQLADLNKQLTIDNDQLTAANQKLKTDLENLIQTILVTNRIQRR